MNKSKLMLIVCMLSFSTAALACCDMRLVILYSYYCQARDGMQHLIAKLVKPFASPEKTVAPQEKKDSPSDKA